MKITFIVSRICLVLIFGLVTNNIFSQQSTTTSTYNFWNSEMQAIAKPESKPGWIYFKDDFTTAPQDIFTTHAAAFGLGADDEMVLVKQKTDDLGWTHYWFQQQKYGHNILMSKSVIHHNINTNEVIMIGYISQSTSFSNQVSITPTNAINNAINNVNAAPYLWEDTILENQMKVIKNDPSFTYYPRAELLYIQESNTLHYKVGVNAQNSELSRMVFINAINGTVTRSNPVVIHANHSVTSPTDIYGHQQIITKDSIDSNGTHLILTDLTRGGGIYQYNSFGNNYVQSYYGEWPVDSLYGQNLWMGEMVYDFIEEFKPNGNILDFPSQMIQRTIAGVSSSAAFYNEYESNILIGITYPFIYVYGHEWAHGIFSYNIDSISNAQTSAEEARAINEGLADILGTIIDFQTKKEYTDLEGNWIYCKDYIGGYKGVQRNLKKPNETTNYSNTCITNIGSNPSCLPDTYMGDCWITVQSGLCALDDFSHGNSTVFGHWFYLLSEGGVGYNDFDYFYNVCGIGKEEAARFLLYAVSSGTINSNLDSLTFPILRDGIVLAANMYFGVNSFEYNQLLEAFNAVGLYENGIQPASIVPANIYIDSIFNASAIINSNITFMGETVISGNSTFEINTADVDFTADSKLRITSGSTLNITNSNLYLGENVEIVIESGANLHCNGSTLQYGTSSCSSIGLDENQWKGITFTGGNSTQCQISNSTIQDAEIALRYFNNLTPSLNIIQSIFTDNKVALVARSASSTSNFVIQSSTFQNPLKYDSNLVDVLGYYPMAYVEIRDFPSITLLRNNFNLPYMDENSSSTNTPPSYREYKCIREALYLGSNLTSSIYTILDNNFRFWPYSLEVNSRGVTNISGGDYTSHQTDHARYYIKAYNDGNVSIESADFYGTRQKNIASIILDGLSQSLVEDNDFFANRRGIYSTSPGDIVNNRFYGIPLATYSNQYGIDNTYAMFIIGEEPRNVRINTIRCNGASYNVNQAHSAGIVFEQTGNAIIQCTENTFEGTDVGIQVEGRNDDLGIFCNTFAKNNHSHAVAGLWLTNNHNPNNSYTDGSLRHQGTDCAIHTQPAGNEWHNLSGNTDIVIDNLASNPSQKAYFTYFAHQYDISGVTTTTTPKHIYGGTWQGTGNNRLNVCYQTGIPNDGSVKLPTSCDDFTTKRVATDDDNEAIYINPDLADLIFIKTDLTTKLNVALAELFDPETQPELVRTITEYEAQLQEVVMKLYDTYMSLEMEAEAKALLEAEPYTEAKKELTEVYYAEGDYEKSRLAQEQLEYITLSKPAYYYASLDEKEAYELNNLYYKEINELLIQAREDLRTEKELIYWELYALQLIAETGLPVAADAEKLLALNHQEVAPHQIEPVPLNFNSYGSTANGFEYTLQMAPNPAMSSTTVWVMMPETFGTASLKLYDAYNNTGELQSHSLISGENNVDLDVSNYNSGIYTVVIIVDNINVVSAQLVVIH